MMLIYKQSIIMKEKLYKAFSYSTEISLSVTGSMMMLPSLLVLYVCLTFGACASTFEEDLVYNGQLDSNPHDEDDFVFTELEFDTNPYPPYPHNMYPLFRVLFLHAAKSDERISGLFQTLLSAMGNAPFLNTIQAIVVWKFNRGDFYPYTPDLFNPKVRVQKYKRSVYNSERDTDEDSENSTENSFDQRIGIVHEEPCDERKDCGNPPLQAGSIRGIPGEDFPDYCDIPITTFSCADKRIPGFYADLETGCQVFHICWPHRRESFLCPVGTIFNQAISACDYWYSSNCSLAPLYYYSKWSSKDRALVGSKESLVDVLEEFRKETPSMPEEHSTRIKHTKLHTAIPESFATESPVVYKSLSPSTRKSQEPPSQPPLVTTHSFESKHDSTADKSRTNKVWAPKSKFLPVKSKITIYSDLSETVDEETVAIPSTKIVPAYKLSRKPLAKKTEKSVSEILQDILKITESVKKETQKFITKFEIDKSKNKFHKLKGESALDETDKPQEIVTIQTVQKFKTTPKRTPRKPLKVEPHPPEIKQRFIVKPVAIESILEKIGKTLQIVTPSTHLNPSELLSMLR